MSGRTIVASAPARVDLAGGWTDVAPYTTEVGGAVCNVAIELRATAVVRTTVGVGETVMTPMDPPLEPLVRAAWERAGRPSVSLSLTSGIPLGSGLGGSSSAGVALAAALAACREIRLSPADLAELSRSTETETLGLAGGCQDHYAAAFGGALLLRCGVETVAERVPMSDATVAAFESRVLVGYTGTSRMSSQTIVAVLEAWRAGDEATGAALAAMADLAPRMAAALGGGDIDLLGTLISAQWDAQRALHPTITTPLIDQIVSEVSKAGALGTKALGASAGGCVLVVARADRVEAVRATLARRTQLIPVQVARTGVQVHDSQGTA